MDFFFLLEPTNPPQAASSNTDPQFIFQEHLLKGASPSVVVKGADSSWQLHWVDLHIIQDEGAEVVASASCLPLNKPCE